MAPYTKDVVRHLIIQRRIFLTLNIVAAICMGIFFYFIHNQNQTIQHQRREAILRSCRDQNMRHDTTIKTLDKLILKLPPLRRVKAEESRQFTILIISALAPKRNCEQLAASATGD